MDYVRWEREVLVRGASDARKALREHWKVAGVMDFLVGVVWTLAEGFTEGGLAAVGIASVAVGGVFLVCIALAPYRLSQDRRVRIAELSEQVALLEGSDVQLTVAVGPPSEKPTKWFLGEGDGPSEKAVLIILEPVSVTNHSRTERLELDFLLADLRTEGPLSFPHAPEKATSHRGLLARPLSLGPRSSVTGTLAFLVPGSYWSAAEPSVDYRVDVRDRLTGEVVPVPLGKGTPIDSLPKPHLTQSADDTEAGSRPPSA